MRLRLFSRTMTASSVTIRSLGLLALLSAIVAVAACNAADKGNAAPDGKQVDPIAALAKKGYLGEEEQWDKHAKMLGQPMPKLELSDFVGKAVTADDMKGKIVVVDFWATWCGPCIKSIPHNNEVYKKYASKGVLLVGACGGGGEETMGDVAKNKGIEYPVAKVTKASTEAWNLMWWPSYGVVDRKGNVRAFGISPESVETVLDALLEEQPPEKK